MPLPQDPDIAFIEELVDPQTQQGNYQPAFDLDIYAADIGDNGVDADGTRNAEKRKKEAASPGAGAFRMGEQEWQVRARPAPEGLYLELECRMPDGTRQCGAVNFANGSDAFGVGLRRAAETGYGTYAARLQAARGRDLVTAFSFAVAPEEEDVEAHWQDLAGPGPLYLLRPHIGVAVEIWGADARVMHVTRYHYYPEWEPEVCPQHSGP